MRVRLHRFTSGLALVFLAVSSAAIAAEPADDPNRWDLRDLFPNVSAWNAERNEVEDYFDALAECEGRLGNPKGLNTCLERYHTALKRLYRVGVYASLLADQDTSQSIPLEMRQQVRRLYTRFSEVTSYMAPELIALGADTIDDFKKRLPRLTRYDRLLEVTLRQAPHVLDPQRESLLASAGAMGGTPSAIYRVLANANIPWPTIKLSDGESVRLSQSGYTKYRQVPERDDRKQVFEAFWSTWQDYEQTMGETFHAHLQQAKFFADARNYDSTLAAALGGTHVPEAVYRNLVKQVNDNLDTLHRYLTLRERILGIDQIEYYDIYPPLVELETDYPIASAKPLVVTAMAPLGEDYVAKLSEGLSARWMDLYPRENKVSGAYMSGSAYGVHPYVLMNYNDDFESVSTLAHEWGHAVHTMLSSETQPFETARYPIFLAEIASTVNEVLLVDDRMQVATTDDEKLYYLGFLLEQWRGTFFRQAMFAEYELQVHEAFADGTPLSGARLSEMYGDILKRYHGHDEGVLTIDPTFHIEWAYIPHFYRNFYVYQYATSITAGAAFAEKILAGDTQARDAYLNMLRAGGSDDPHALLVAAGVDMTTAAPYEAVFRKLNGVMDQIEAILDNQEQ
ncbi:oligoendopeptidase F [Abyssibacter sp.]|uniref:oligoendopeptidase F n=1 Tax=Abyssibacter sp. TaxID=2320200 RepID=UPI000C4E2987|nr:oligoendopeptidase F [Xanthomonadales bacterium]